VSWYGDNILPRMTTLACSTKPTRKQRLKIVPRAKGVVLEIGAGSGLNFPYYDAGKVKKILALEPSDGMRRLARRKLSDLELEIEFIDLPGEEIPLDAKSVDTVLVTYTLCTIPDAQSALAGMRRVLKPGGRLLFCEHGSAPDENIRRWQDRLNPLWSRLAGGCNMNRDIPGMLQTGGFRIETEERMYIPGPRILSYNYWGSAKSM
jgi:ubiquinone/menaquinone biosynthesis C-methylase UbiE